MGRDSVKFNAQGAHDLDHGIEPWLRAGGEGLVETCTTQARVLGYLRHAACFGHMTDRADQFISVADGQDLRQVLADSRLTVEQLRHVEWDQGMRHDQTSFASFLACRISAGCVLLSPPTSRTMTMPPRTVKYRR